MLVLLHSKDECVRKMNYIRKMTSHSEVNDGDKHRHVVIPFTRSGIHLDIWVSVVTKQATEPKPGHGKNNHHLHPQLKERSIRLKLIQWPQPGVEVAGLGS